MKSKIHNMVGGLLAAAIVASACSSSNGSSEGITLDPAETTVSTPATEAPTTTAANSTTEASQTTETNQPTEADPTEDDLKTVLDGIVTGTGVPALGVAVFDGTGMLDIAVSGVRRRDADTEVTVDDRFHIGSNTKALTAALVARLEEEGGEVTFDTTLAQAFPAVDQMNAEYASVTIAQLMRHSGGVPSDPGVPDSLLQLPVIEARAQGAELVLSEPPETPPGTLARYSNTNYVLVGAALEASTGESWEDLMTAHVFEPLGMDSCGFGAPGVQGETDEPLGHDAAGDAVYIDNPPVIGPAGTVHCSMTHWGMFLVELLNGSKGESDFLSQQSVKRLFEPNAVPVEGVPGGQNALGWLVFEDPQGPVYWHNGSNTLWYSQAIINPAADRVMMTVTNEAASGQQAADMALEVLVDRYAE